MIKKISFIFFSFAMMLALCLAGNTSRASVLSYSTYLGGTSDDNINGMVLDNSGNVYVGGYTTSAALPTSNPYQGTNTGGADGFVSKLTSSGSSLSYSTYVGGTSDDWVSGIAIDSTGNAYAGGYTTSPNFPTLSPYQATNKGGSDAFITKLSSSGSALGYSTYLGGASSDSVNGIITDSSGNAYAVGYTASSNFPTLSPYQGTYSLGFGDSFVTKIGSTGATLAYSTYLGGSGMDYANAAVLDSAENAYVGGYTTSANFPTLNAYQGASPVSRGEAPGGTDGFVTKITSAGGALSYSTYLGGIGTDMVEAIVLDSSENAYVAGRTASTNFPNLASYQGTYNGGSFDGFVTKLDSTGATISNSTFLGGSDNDQIYGIALDTSEDIYVGGHTASANFPTRNPFQGSFSGVFDGFAAKLGTSGSSLLNSTYIGGAADDYIYGVAVDSAGNAYVAGYTQSTDLPTLNPFQGTNAGLSDGFIAKLRTPLSTIGVFRASTARFYLRNSNSAGPTNISFSYGSSTDLALRGNWDGDSDATIGIYRPSTSYFYLRNTNSAGAADLSFPFGASGDAPLTGSWDGTGATTIGVFRASANSFYLRNSNSAGGPDLSFTFGTSTDTPIAGDWDGDGISTIGVYRPSNRYFYLRNSNSSGPADLSFAFGSSGDLPVIGDWNGDGTETVGLYRQSNSTFYLKNSNSTGPADVSFKYGASTDTPLSGDWDGM